MSLYLCMALAFLMQAADAYQQNHFFQSLIFLSASSLFFEKWIRGTTR